MYVQFQLLGIDKVLIFMMFLLSSCFVPACSYVSSLQNCVFFPSFCASYFLCLFPGFLHCFEICFSVILMSKIMS